MGKNIYENIEMCVCRDRPLHHTMHVSLGTVIVNHVDMTESVGGLLDKK